MIDISLSIVSHGQLSLIHNLLQDLQALYDPTKYKIEVILTLNIPEQESILAEKFDFGVIVIRNQIPRGFGANHNAAFQRASGHYFCVVNPDIRLYTNPLSALVLEMNDVTGVVAPLVMSPSGGVEVSARKFPTPWKIFLKIVGSQPTADYSELVVRQEVDWTGGMFMLFSRQSFEALAGFDERYFLYYEDVDLCARIWLAGLKVVLIPQAVVVHDAQRSSHRSFKYASWHLKSMSRFFFSGVFYRVMRMRRGEVKK